MTLRNNSRLVYTTDPEPETAPEPAPSAPPSARRQNARVSRERSGRNGKTVTLISGLRHDPATFERLLKQLKTRCGTGGTFKDGVLELQGDQRERAAAVLTELGYAVKVAG